MLGKTLKKLNAFLLCICLIAVQIGTLPAAALSYPAYGVVTNENGAPIYSQPGFIDSSGHDGRLDKDKDSIKIETLVYETKVKILATVADGDGDLWYEVNYGDGYQSHGFAYSTRVTLIGSYEEDTDFEKWLTEQNFPESYKVKLRDLHSLYPNWVFYADHLNLEWDAVVAEEAKFGRKTVYKGWPDSWKSLEPEAYDAATGTWYELDSGGWVAASKMTVAYYTDPRNFLDSKNVFMFSSHTYNKENDTKENLLLMLKGKFMDSVLPSPPDAEGRTYADAIMNAAEKSNVSPLVIAANILQEQGSQGTGGNIAGNIEGYEGYFNFFNIWAYADFVNGTYMTAVQRGLWYAKGQPNAGGVITATSYGRPWDSREKAIMGGAEWYADGYISAGQDTYYYMNFDVIATGGMYNHQYASNVQDSSGKAKFLASAYSEVMDGALVFHIPVYKNMPDFTRLPEETGNNNNFLTSLGVKGYTLHSFNKYATSGYELIVENEVSEIEITAVAESALAKVEGIGKKTLEVGINEFIIKVTASSGEVREYQLSVSREAGTEPPPTPTISNTYKAENNILSGIGFGVSIGDFTGKLAVQNGTIKLFSKDGKEKQSGNIATGDAVKIYDKKGAEKLSFTVLIRGDINSDSEVSIVDLAMVQAGVLGLYELKDVYLSAADINNDKNITIVDLAMVQAAVLGIYTINQ
ncbi:MAG: cadherin-like beta sandwich domain-containing protein [Clostridia bacterium]|nr:cadherin-like beta sandwich domain-containing protein [Clostridia bacterium]